MPSKPAPIKKAAKKAPAKKEEKKAPEPAPAPAPEPAPAPAPEPAPEPPPAEAPPAEAAPAEAAPAPAEGEAPPAEGAPAEGAAPAEAAPAEPPAEVPRPPTPPPPDAATPAKEEPAAAAEAPADEPTSVPLELFVEDKNDTSVTIVWSPPATIGHSGLDGYTIEICKDGTEDWKAVNEDLQKSCRYIIKNQTTGDRLKIRVVALNPGGRSPPLCLLDAVVVKEVTDRPKCRLPRFLRQRFVAYVGDKINLTFPFSGKPKPVVSWSKNGQPVDGKRVNIRSTERDSILFIRTAEREDSGVYEMSVKVEDFDDKCHFTLQIVELPGPPTIVKIVDTWGFNVALEWTVPKDNGNTEITGYTIQKADKKTGDWFTVGENYHRLTATISDLVMGNTYKFRVFTENKCGKSLSPAVAKGEAKILKTGIVYQPPNYKDHDSSEAPKFTTALIDKITTLGYNTKLHCAVRGAPKPKIEWMKNQAIIIDDPKYRQLCIQGVCSLEIRRPSNFDGGIYSCRAINDHGTDIVVCKLEVKPVVIAEADKK